MYVGQSKAGFQYTGTLTVRLCHISLLSLMIPTVASGVVLQHPEDEVGNGLRKRT